MEMLAAWLVKGGLSTVFGGLFSWLEIREKKKHDRLVMEMQYKDQQADRAHKMKYAAAEAASAENKLIIETEGEIEVAELDAMKAAMLADKATYSTGIKIKLTGWWGKFISGIAAFMMFTIDFYRGVIRPTITVYGWALITYVLVKFAPLFDSMTADQKYTIFLMLINAVVFMTVRATGFWFGDRGKTPTIKNGELVP